MLLFCKWSAHRGSPIRSGLNPSQYQRDKICRPADSPPLKLQPNCHFLLYLLTMHRSLPVPGPPRVPSPPTTVPYNRHSPDKTQAFQPAAPAWERQTELRRGSPPAPSALPFPGTKTDDFILGTLLLSAAQPPWDQSRGRQEAEGGRSSGYFGTHRTGLCGVSVAAFKPEDPQPPSRGSSCPASRASHVTTSPSTASTLHTALGDK